MEPSHTASRELTLDEAVAIAILLQKNDQLAEADALYREILTRAPNHVEALHYAGVLAHQQGRTLEAISLIERSLAAAPDRADWYSNLGILLQSSGRLEEAVEAYGRALALDPNHANAHSNLGVLLKAQGRLSEAECEYRAAIRSNPDHIDAHANLGILLNALGRTKEAAACYCRVITLRPKHREARKLLALAHCTLGDVGEAVKIYQEWLREEPDDPIARHMLAACTGQDAPGRASNGFIERTFDGFAASFEAKLTRLSYRAPALVAAMIPGSGLEPTKGLDVLDAGCGTGLCGPLVLPYARRLVGVDLSDGMLAHAREKAVYSDLIKSEMTDYLREHPDSFDLIVSADTLVYFGDLECVIREAARALRPGGRFIFTLEHATGDRAVRDYGLELHGRYSHGRPYVEGLLTTAGLHAHIELAELRMEAGVPVPGLVVRATKAAPRSSTSAPPLRSAE